MIMKSMCFLKKFVSHDGTVLVFCQLLPLLGYV